MWLEAPKYAHAMKTKYEKTNGGLIGDLKEQNVLKCFCGWDATGFSAIWCLYFKTEKQKKTLHTGWKDSAEVISGLKRSLTGDHLHRARVPMLYLYFLPTLRFVEMKKTGNMTLFMCCHPLKISERNILASCPLPESVRRCEPTARRPGLVKAFHRHMMANSSRQQWALIHTY